MTEEEADINTAIDLGYKNLKTHISSWVAKACEAITKEMIVHGWEKLTIHDCWTASWQARADRERERLSAPVRKKNAKNLSEVPSFEEESSEDEGLFFSSCY